jgi:hypothetical protein
VTDIRDRDDSVDRLLRQTLRTPQDAVVTESCLDPETMATWIDGGLSGASLAAAETHTASCPRCQAMVAAMARTEPAGAPVAVAPHATPWRTRSWLPWLIPVAAAAVVVIAIVLPRKTPAPVLTVTQIARQETAPPAVPPAPIVGQSPAPAALADRALPVVPKNALADQAARKREATKAAPTSAETKLTAIPPAATQTPPAQPPAAPLPAAAPVPPPMTTTATVTSSTAASQLPSTANITPVTPAFRTAAEVAPTTIVAAFASPDLPLSGAVGGVAGGAAGGGGGGRGGGRGGGGAGAARAAGAANVNQPLAPPLQWRVFASGVVERSITAGATWEPVTIDPPNLRVTSGVAPSRLVCWLVGRGGAVLISIDGLHFTRVTFPETVDLVSIRATNERQATMTAVDGRVFTTTDGGQTWQRGGE